MSRDLLSLLMMVKDEAGNIRSVLESVKPYVQRWTILDTGSTDGTQAIIREVMGDFPGKLFEEPFVGCTLMPDRIDYGATRNRVLDLDASWGQPAEFGLMFSGDEHLRDGKKLTDELEKHRAPDPQNIDCFFVRVSIGGSANYQPRVLRTGSAWRYEGELHEVPTNRTVEDAPKRGIDGPEIAHIVSDPERRLGAIWEHHIPLLRAKLEENAEDARSLTLLAQSYEALLPGFSPVEQVMYSLESMGLLMRRMALPLTGDAERNYYTMQYLDFARVANIYTSAELFQRIDDLCQCDPARPEPALMRAQVAIKAKPLAIVYELARQAAEIAGAYRPDNSSPVSTSTCWEAHRLAAVAAKQLAHRYPEKEWSKLMREHVSAGVAAGGDWEMFKPIMQPASTESAEQASEPA